MYCRKCGAYVPGNEEYCENCRVELAAQKEVTPRLDMSAEGRGAAIASIVLGVVSLVLMFVAIICLAAESVGGAVFVGLACLACTVLGIINGIRGIVAFRRACRAKASKPIASLVCGIVGLEIAAVTLIYLFCLGFVGAIALAVSDSSSYYRYY